MKHAAESSTHDALDPEARCVIVGGAGMDDYCRARSYLKEGDYVIYCDSGLRHMEALGAEPSLIVGDWDSYTDPGLDAETITLPVIKDDTDSVFAAKEAMRRGFRDFLILGGAGGRLDHTLVNVYLLTMLHNAGCEGVLADDGSEMRLVASAIDADGATRAGEADIEDSYPFFSLLAMEGPARGVSIINAKYLLNDAVIEPGYQYATSNEVLPGKMAHVTVTDGRLLLIKICR